jgi:MFS family permease
VIDLSLAKISTYRECLAGGGLFYMTTTSSVFLLSILFQIGFGYSAFNAGLMTLAVAGGTTLARFALRPILRLVRFRAFLLANAAVTGAYLVACGFFRPGTPYVLLVLTLFVGGLSRALQFTAIASLSYAEIPRDVMSRATSLSAMSQQFAQSLGVGLAAFIVQFSVSTGARETLTAADIAPAYWAIGAASFLSIPVFARLRAQVGEDMRERDAGARGA